MEKKGKLISDKYAKAGNLDAIASQAGMTVEMADSINGNASFSQGIGYEPKVVGYAFNDKFQPNSVSPAIKGREAVFFISLTHRTPNAKPVDPQAFDMQAKMQDMQTKNMVAQSISESLRRRADIKYKPENIF
jgi:peptidyl-prolyl cis-trans isomerase D